MPCVLISKCLDVPKSFDQGAYVSTSSLVILAMETDSASDSRVVVPVYLPPGVSPRTDIGRGLTSLILELAGFLTPTWGITLAIDLAHFCVLELPQAEGFELFTQLHNVSIEEIQSARVLTTRH